MKMEVMVKGCWKCDCCVLTILQLRLGKLMLQLKLGQYNAPPHPVYYMESQVARDDKQNSTMQDRQKNKPRNWSDPRHMA